jgi:DNA-directed RNA polymerase specialized sigma24 family protein
LEHLRAPTSWNLAIARRLEDTEDPKLFADWAPDVLNVESVASLRAELSKLRPSEKMAIDLAYFEGRSQREIADYFGQPLRTIKALIRSALVNLWKAVEGAEPDLSRFRPPVVIRPYKVTPTFGINSALSAGSDIDRDRS